MTKKIIIGTDDVISSSTIKSDGWVYGATDDGKFKVVILDNENENGAAVAITNDLEAYIFPSKQEAVEEFIEEGYELFYTDDGMEQIRFFFEGENNSNLFYDAKLKGEAMAKEDLIKKVAELERYKDSIKDIKAWIEKCDKNGVSDMHHIKRLISDLEERSCESCKYIEDGICYYDKYCNCYDGWQPIEPSEPKTCESCKENFDMTVSDVCKKCFNFVHYTPKETNDD